jgi:hypothetical protein
MSMAAVPTLLEVCHDLQAACRSEIKLFPPRHLAPTAGPRLPDPPSRRTLLYAAPVPLTPNLGTCEVTVVGSRVRDFRRQRWKTPQDVVKSLRLMDAVVLVWLAPEGPNQNRQGVVFDLNRRHVRVGYWTAEGGLLERDSGFEAIDYFMADYALTHDANRKWAKMTGHFGVTDVKSELPCYTGPAVLTHSRDGPRQLWRTWAHLESYHPGEPHAPGADPTRPGLSTTIVVEVPGGEPDDTAAPDNVRILTGLSAIDPSSPMGFSMLPSWIGYKPGTHELTVAVENGEDPALIAAIDLSDEVSPSCQLHAFAEDGHPLCVAAGTVGAPGELSKLMARFTALAARTVAPGEPQDDDNGHQCCRETHASVCRLVGQWVDDCRRPLQHCANELPLLPGELAELLWPVPPLSLGAQVIVESFPDAATAKVSDGQVTLDVPISVLESIECDTPLGLRRGHELWLASGSARVRTTVVGGSSGAVCVTSPLVPAVATVMRPHERRCAPPSVACPDPYWLHCQLLRAGVAPSWTSVREEMGVAGELLGVPGLSVDDQVVCNVSLARLLHPWGQHPPRAPETYGRTVKIEEWNACSCLSDDCQRRRYCVSPAGWPKELDRRVADTMLSRSTAEAVPSHPIGSVVVVDAPGRYGYGVVCGGGISVTTGQNVIHVVRLGVERTKPNDVVYACVDAAYTTAVDAAEARRLLELEASPEGSRDPTEEQLELQQALIDQEEAHMSDRQLKKARKAAQRALSARRQAFWRSIVAALAPRVGFIDHVGPFVSALAEQRCTRLRELNQLRILLDRYAPGVLRCPLSDTPLVDAVFEAGHCYNAGALREWTELWGERADARLPRSVEGSDGVVPIRVLVRTLMSLKAGP